VADGHDLAGPPFHGGDLHDVAAAGGVDEVLLALAADADGHADVPRVGGGPETARDEDQVSGLRRGEAGHGDPGVDLFVGDPGMATPAAAQDCWVRLEQSHASGPLAPNRYGSPSCAIDVSRRWVRSMSRTTCGPQVIPSGIDRHEPPNPLASTWSVSLRDLDARLPRLVMASVLVGLTWHRASVPARSSARLLPIRCDRSYLVGPTSRDCSTPRRTTIGDVSGDSVRYRTHLTDSARWDGFAFRSNDIVISTPPKCGTTWIQMICALLVFQSAELPAPLADLSPWLDMELHPLDEVRRRLEAQEHRRFIKTHTPLDGLPSAPGVTYLVVGRDPRDVGVSMYHHRGNVRPEVLHRLPAHTGFSNAGKDQTVPAPAPLDLREWLLRWINDDSAVTAKLSSLRSTVAHLRGAWDRRHESDIVLIHYADLSADLEREMRRLAARLGITVPARRYPDLVQAATFTRMRARSQELLPNRVLRDPTAFFHSGSSGQWRDPLTDGDIVRYQQRLASLAPPDLVQWLHHS
jgi:aryl sulfotransferase